MAIVFDSTIKGISSNSYISVSRADDIIAVVGTNSTAWNLLTNGQKENLLIACTTMIENQYSFDGYRTEFDTQRLSFPRAELYFDGVALDQDAIPYQVEEALARLASSQNAADMTVDVSNGGLTSLRVGPISLNFSEDDLDSKKIPSIVDDLLSNFGGRKYSSDDPSASFSR